MSSAQELQIASLTVPRACWPCTAAASFCIPPTELLCAVGHRHLLNVCRLQTSALTSWMRSVGEANSCSRGKQGLHPALLSACLSPVCDAFNQFYPQRLKHFPPGFAKPFSSRLSRLAGLGGVLRGHCCMEVNSRVITESPPRTKPCVVLNK